ncbi:MAG: GC-type dockerin domain-anchored protein [Phycisphaerales bacterium]
MPFVRTGSIAACSFIVAASPAQPLPASVAGYEVLARGVFNGPGFALPPESQVTNITPRLNHAGDVVFAYFDALLDKRIWVNGVTVPSAPPFFLSSDPHINADGDAVWRVSTLDPDPSKWGVWKYDASTGTAARLTTDPLGAGGWGSPVINDAGLVAYRAEFQFSDALGIYDGSSFQVIATDTGNPYTFITSGIGFNNSNQICGRVFRNGAPNGVAVFEDDGSSVVIITDGSLSPSGDTFSGFLNGTDISDQSRVAINAFTSGSAEIIGVDLNGAVTVYADEDQPEINEIELFNPVINTQGWIAFRAVNSAGRQCVFVADGTELLEVAAVGTTLTSDAGPAVITGFSGGLDINDAGQILINVALETPAGASLGRAIVRADLDTGACLADVNGNGVLDPGDFTAWVTAYNAGDASADQNQNGALDPGDFTAWVTNYNAGC